MRYVIQKHAARALHYDLRLEVDGVLRSWAVPRGPSLDPREKRLAVEVDDHALSHGSFEGTIGRGLYGAGAVIVWDNGTYRPLGDDPSSIGERLDAGHLSFWIDGVKLFGGFTLHRTQEGAKPQWLLIKRRDEAADETRDPVTEEPESVLSGRTVEELSRSG